MQFLQVNLNLSSSRHSLGQAVSGFSLLVDLNTLREKAEPKQSEPDTHTCHQAVTSVCLIYHFSWRSDEPKIIATITAQLEKGGGSKFD